jgi:hypothetical protein
MIWMSGVYLHPGTELDEVEKDVLKRLSKKMTTDMEKRQKMGMMMVRKSSLWPGGAMAGVSTDALMSSSKKLLLTSVTFLNFLFLMFSIVEFIFPISISPKKVVWQIVTHNMARVIIKLMSKN